MRILNSKMIEITEQRFLKAYDIASHTGLKFPPDIMLHFYAYFKRATLTNGFYTPRDPLDIRNGFKANALRQVENLTRHEAKIQYIEMVEKYIGGEV